MIPHKFITLHILFGNSSTENPLMSIRFLLTVHIHEKKFLFQGYLHHFNRFLSVLCCCCYIYPFFLKDLCALDINLYFIQIGRPEKWTNEIGDFFMDMGRFDWGNVGFSFKIPVEFNGNSAQI